MDIQTIERTYIVIWGEGALYSVNKRREKESKKDRERARKEGERERKDKEREWYFLLKCKTWPFNAILWAYIHTLQLGF